MKERIERALSSGSNYEVVAGLRGCGIQAVGLLGNTFAVTMGEGLPLARLAFDGGIWTLAYEGILGLAVGRGEVAARLAVMVEESR